MKTSAYSDRYPAIELQGINDVCMRGSIVYSLFWFLSTGGARNNLMFRFCQVCAFLKFR